MMLKQRCFFGVVGILFFTGFFVKAEPATFLDKLGSGVHDLWSRILPVRGAGVVATGSCVVAQGIQIGLMQVLMLNTNKELCYKTMLLGMRKSGPLLDVSLKLGGILFFGKSLCVEDFEKVCTFSIDNHALEVPDFHYKIWGKGFAGTGSALYHFELDNGKGDGAILMRSWGTALGLGGVSGFIIAV